MALRPTSPFPDSIERYKKHEPKGRNITLVVLKGHLLVEEELNELLELLLPNPEFLYQPRFGFIQRLRVLQAISTEKRLHALADAIELLNEMRNSLAHQLEPTKLNKQALAFTNAALNAARTNPKPKGDLKAQVVKLNTKFSLPLLKQCIAIIIGSLAHMKKKYGPAT